MTNETNDSDLDAKIQEFVDEHGVEGFYVLYFTDFISHFILQELKSPTESDPGTSSLHQADVETVQEIKQEIRERSEFWARQLVEELDESVNLRDKLASGTMDDSLGPDEFEEIVDKTFDDWESQKDEFIQNVQDKYEL